MKTTSIPSHASWRFHSRETNSSKKSSTITSKSQFSSIPSSTASSTKRWNWKKLQLLHRKCLWITSNKKWRRLLSQWKTRKNKRTSLGPFVTYSDKETTQKMQTFSRPNGSLPSPQNSDNDLLLIKPIHLPLFSPFSMALLRPFSLSFAAYYNLISEAHEEQQRHKQIETSQEQGQKNKAKGKTRHWNSTGRGGGQWVKRTFLSKPHAEEGRGGVAAKRQQDAPKVQV